MKRFFYTLAALCIGCTNFLSADSCCADPCYTDCCEEPCCPCAPEWSVEFRIGAYIPTNTKKCDHYSDVWADYQVQIAKRFCNDWQAFIEFDAAQINGNRHHDGIDELGLFERHHKSDFWVMPLTFGVKYFFNLCQDFNIYVGGGAAYTFLTRSENDRRIDDVFGERRNHNSDTKGAWGGVLKTGVIYTFCNSWFVDVFADYLFQKFDFKRRSDPFSTTDFHHNKHTLDVSGFKIGAGIGYNF